MNNVVLIGRLARDTELSYTPTNQTPVCRFTLAVDRPRKNGEEQGADFIKITVWGKMAENCDRYLAKGKKCAIQGFIQTGSYKNKEGATIYTTEVVANNVEFLTPPQTTTDVHVEEEPTQETFDEVDSFEAVEDEIPF